MTKNEHRLDDKYFVLFLFLIGLITLLGSLFFSFVAGLLLVRGERGCIIRIRRKKSERQQSNLGMSL